MNELIKVKDLYVSYRNSRRTTEVLNGLSFSISEGQTLVIVGGSGSGKSTLGKALTGLLPPSTYISGELKFDNEIFDFSDSKFNWREIRGKKIGHIFQDPRASLNPRKKIKSQFYETLVISHSYTKEECNIKAKELLKLLNFRDIEKVLDSYPFQLSGGMCQRVSIALSLSLEPDLLIADEITSALDLKSQYELINLVNDIKDKLNAGILFITHDLLLAEKIGDKIMFLDKGILEDNKKNKAIKEKYRNEAKKIERKNTESILMVNNLSKNYDSNIVLSELSFDIKKGEVFGILGESGCGKSTLARLISGIESSYSGEINFENRSLLEKLKKEKRFFYKDIQIIFQDERGSLNPYEKIISIVEESIKNLRPDIANPKELSKKCLNAVGLDESLHNRKSSNLSTGQCQRVSIARAIAVEPKLLILDEVVSALDMSIKMQILNLLKELQEKTNVTMLMISHEIEALQATCQRVAMMKDGKFIEIIDIDDESIEKMKNFLMEV